MTAIEQVKEILAGTVTMDEAAEALGVSISTIYRWGRIGRIRRVRLSRRTQRFDISPLVRELQAQEKGE
jgi:excisionase family DNA binding protein